MTEPAAPRWPDPVPGKAAEVDRNLWIGYQAAKRAAAVYDKQAREQEAQIREQIGDAAVLTVAGVKVAVRVVQDVDNVSWRKDFFRSTGAVGGGHECDGCGQAAVRDEQTGRWMHAMRKDDALCSYVNMISVRPKGGRGEETE